MKHIIFSRKGFDSSSGRVPSPIINNQILSLPIPETVYKHNLAYEDLSTNIEGFSIGEAVEHLSRGKIKQSTPCHLDPDLNIANLTRLKKWKPAFGQANAAQKHLDNNEVEKGDLFLFFGWFREVKKIGEKWKYKRKAVDRHVIFGWLQVEEKIKIDNDSYCKQVEKKHPWLAYHPHLQLNSTDTNNTIFIGRDWLELPRLKKKIKGGGIFPNINAKLVLTNPDQAQNRWKRSNWRLPSWVFPSKNKPPLTYHSNKDRWAKNRDYCFLQTVGRGQEFILRCDEYPQSIEWARDLILTGLE